ncbi:MAG: hypothetical protein ACRCRZ_02535 [Metamycoplasmataceae bacterium]
MAKLILKKDADVSLLKRERTIVFHLQDVISKSIDLLKSEIEKIEFERILIEAGDVYIIQTAEFFILKNKCLINDIDFISDGNALAMVLQGKKDNTYFEEYFSFGNEAGKFGSISSEIFTNRKSRLEERAKKAKGKKE